MEKETKEQEVKENSKKSIKIPIILIVAVIIIAIIVAIVFAMKNKNKGTVNEQNVTAEENVSNGEEVSLIDMNNTANAEVINGSKQNTSSALKEDKKYQDMDVKDIKLNTEGGLTNFTATVENNSGKDFAGGVVVLIFTNEDGSEYARLEGILPEIKNGGSTVLDTGTTADISNAYDFRIESAE